MNALLLRCSDLKMMLLVHSSMTITTSVESSRLEISLGRRADLQIQRRIPVAPAQQSLGFEEE